MNTFQRLFDRLVGIADTDTALHQQEHQVFCERSQDLSLLERPACWRRTAMVRTRRGP